MEILTGRALLASVSAYFLVCLSCVCSPPLSSVACCACALLPEHNMPRVSPKEANHLPACCFRCWTWHSLQATTWAAPLWQRRALELAYHYLYLCMFPLIKDLGPNWCWLAFISWGQSTGLDVTCCGLTVLGRPLALFRYYSCWKKKNASWLKKLRIP